VNFAVLKYLVAEAFRPGVRRRTGPHLYAVTRTFRVLLAIGYGLIGSAIPGSPFQAFRYSSIAPNADISVKNVPLSLS